MIAALAVSLLLAPQQPDRAAQDVLHLLIGTELSGRIVLETPDYIEIELGPGTTVGMATSKIASIERATPEAVPASGGAGEAAPRDAAAVIEGRFRSHDDWNVLHDASGEAVGWMHATVTPTVEGGNRVGEEWRFVQDGRDVETTLLEVIDADGRPVSAFCHERTRSEDGRLSADHVVHAVIQGDTLRVRVQSPRGTETRSYPVEAGLRFPLELQEELRGRPAGAQALERFPVFDPMLEQFEARTFDVGRTRRVALGRGDATPVRLLSAISGRGQNTEWLDASARPLRREIAGPALVAVRVSDEDEARRRTAAKHAEFPPSFHAEPDGRFGLWLPGPSWVFADDDRADEVTARDAVDEASLSLVRIPQLGADLGLESAADAVVRWLRLAHRELRVGERGGERIRGVESARIRASAVRHDGEHVELLVHVLRVGDEWFASCAAAPRHAFGRLEPELVWMVEHFELRSEGFAPEFQGPLAKPGSRTGRSARSR